MFADTNRQLRKLSIYKPMQFRVTEIDFDFDSDSFDRRSNGQPKIVKEIIDEVLRQQLGRQADADDLNGRDYICHRLVHQV